MTSKMSDSTEQGVRSLSFTIVPRPFITYFCQVVLAMHLVLLDSSVFEESPPKVL